MKPSNEQPEEIDSLPDLEFPVAPDFVSRPPKASLAQMVERWGKMRAMFPVQPEWLEGPARDKSDVEFRFIAD